MLNSKFLAWRLKITLGLDGAVIHLATFLPMRINTGVYGEMLY